MAERNRDEAKAYSESALASKNDAKESEEQAKICVTESATILGNIQEAIKNKAEQSDLDNLRNFHYTSFNDLENRKADISYINDTFATKTSVEQGFGEVNGKKADKTYVDNTFLAKTDFLIQREFIYSSIDNKADTTTLEDYYTKTQVDEKFTNVSL